MSTPDSDLQFEPLPPAWRRGQLYSREDAEAILRGWAGRGTMTEADGAPGRFRLAPRGRPPGEATIAKRMLAPSLAANDEWPDTKRAPKADSGDLARYVLDREFAGGKHLRRLAGMYWRYEAGVWRLVDVDIVRGIVQRTLGALREEKGPLAALARRGDIATHTSRVLQYLTGGTAHDDADPMGLMRTPRCAINVRNGTLHFAPNGSYELRPHDPADFCTAMLPVDFDANANAPEWDAFLERAFAGRPDTSDIIRHFEELAGYALQPVRWFKAWLLLFGPTDAGKSGLMRVLMSLLGDSALQAPMARFGTGYEHAFASLVGKQCLLDDDFARTSLLPDGFLKTASEQKLMSANPKHGREFSFLCRVVPVVLANHAPRSADISQALVDRAQVFRLGNRLSKDSPHYGAVDRIIAHELPGVLAQLVAAFGRLRKRGHLLVPESCKQDRAAWAAKAERVAAFVSDQIVTRVPGGPAYTLRPSIAWAAYQDWERAAGGSHRMSKSEFSEKLAELVGERVRDDDSCECWPCALRSHLPAEDQDWSE